MITCDAVSVSLYRNTGVSLSRHAVTHDFAGALTLTRRQGFRNGLYGSLSSVQSRSAREAFDVLVELGEIALYLYLYTSTSTSPLPSL
jgi:hypothetical protein